MGRREAICHAAGPQAGLRDGASPVFSLIVKQRTTLCARPVHGKTAQSPGSGRIKVISQTRRGLSSGPVSYSISLAVLETVQQRLL